MAAYATLSDPSRWTLPALHVRTGGGAGAAIGGGAFALLHPDAATASSSNEVVKVW